MILVTRCLSPFTRASTSTLKAGEDSAEQYQTGCRWNQREEEIFKTVGDLALVERLIKEQAATMKELVSPLFLLSVTSPVENAEATTPTYPLPSGTMLPTY